MASILHVTMSDLLSDAARRASRYLETLDARSVAPTREAIAALGRFEQAFPEHGSTAESVVEELDEVGSPATMASAGGRFFGFVIGGSLPVTVAANLLATAWDQNAALVVTSPARRQRTLPRSLPRDTLCWGEPVGMLKRKGCLVHLRSR